MKYLVRFEFPSGYYVDTLIDGNTKLTAHFRVKEYANTKGRITKPQLVLNSKVWQLYMCFEEFRSWYYSVYRKGITVNSNYRQIDFNRQIGGDARSLHLDGLAIDWACVPAAKTEEARKTIETKWKSITMSHGLIAGCNWYDWGYHFSVGEEKFGHSNFVHRDYRGKKGD